MKFFAKKEKDVAGYTQKKQTVVIKFSRNENLKVWNNETYSQLNTQDRNISHQASNTFDSVKRPCIQQRHKEITIYR